ncbi:juvenile hormone esterase-like [Halictus rubicundus]|uniref:juvenile hormone esterase-like n=1 Tax=Halictus rubicundus TaxID=77578 RepID=UPI004036E1EC
MIKPVVSAKQGKLRGTYVESALGLSYIAFRGIPFAAPPIGELRFKDPKPPERWKGIKDTTEVRVNVSPQRVETPPYNMWGDEDCLYLNVYTSSLTVPKPVMFWVHSGGFITGAGTSTTWGPDYIIPKNVVVVSPNYRLGSFGFLNLEHKDASGNMGLKDLILALKWVIQNIENFGGDPNNITVFGCSAGAVLAHALAISPLSRGLFHKLILQSGTVTCPWGFTTSKKSFRLVSILGIDSTDPEEILQRLRKLPATDIIKAQTSLLTTHEACMYEREFGLCIDTASESPALPESIEKLLSNDINLPMIVGHLSDEFIFFFKDNNEKNIDIFNEYFSKYVELLASTKKLGSEEIKELTETVKDRYFKELPAGQDNIREVLNFLGDVYIILPIKLFLEDRLNRSSEPTYFYKFGYVGNQKSFTDLLINRCISGASHCDELAYLFNLLSCKSEQYVAPARGTKDRAVMERLTTMWANFAKTGNPTPTLNGDIKVPWEQATKDKIYYLEIDEECKLSVLPPHVFNAYEKQKN